MSNAKRVAWAAATLLGLSLTAVLPTASAATAPTPILPGKLPPAGNVEAGSQKAVVCTACHGPNGNSANPEWPSLAGQNAAYIREQLNLFKAGQRNNPIMYPLAMPLTDEDIADLSAYFAVQTPAGLEADPEHWKKGETLYRAGDRARQIPSCKACHGPVGRGNPGAGYPALQAQHSVYTIKQLTDYAAEQRYVDMEGKPARSRNGHMMTTISKRLTADDMRDLAAYIQGIR
jgi:cytochrome c553